MGWTKANAQDEIRPGDRIDPIFLTTTYDPDNTHTINLYAVWEKIVVDTPQAQQIADQSPAAGDNTPTGILLILMIASAEVRQ